MLDLTILVATLGVVVGRAFRLVRRGGEVLQSSEPKPSRESLPAGISPLVPLAVREPGSTGSDEAIA